MALFTRSKFYLGLVIDASNNQIEFDEGAGSNIALITPGSYTLDTILTAIKTAMDAEGDFTYDVTLDRVTRFITISSADGNFDLLTNSGSTSNPWTILGFDTTVDQTGDDNYSSITAAGEEYIPQFILQSYVGPDDSQDKIDAVVNESANGIIEVVSFGTRQFIEFNIKYITNNEVTGQYYWINDQMAVEKAREFMQFLITKDALEFMPDLNDPDTFYKVRLENTPDSKTGTGYKLKELYSQNLVGFFETGVLEFRVDNF